MPTHSLQTENSLHNETMFFNDFVQRKLSALLQPWLRENHDIELKLGLFRSNGTLNNISFSTSALNELLDDPSTLCFKEVTVEQLSLQFSPFSPAAFTLVVRGLRIVLSLGEEEDEGGAKWRRKPRDTTVEERNAVLEEIDPEGCALHGAIKKISDITTTTRRTSLLNTLIRHCHLQLHDVLVLLQSPRLDGYSCSLYMKKFEAGSQIIGQRCFIRGFMSSFFVPCGESSFDVRIDSFEIRLNSENRKSCVFPATNMFALVNLNHLRSMSFCFHVPALNFVFSPADLSVLFLLNGLLSKEHKNPRPGRQLWNLAAARISSLLPNSNPSFIKVVRIVSLWLRYLSIYQSVLQLIGYPADEIMKRSATLMFRDTNYSRSVRSQWKLIGEIEKDLPLEAIAVARRIIRYRVVSSDPGKRGHSYEQLATRPFLKLHQLLVVFFNMIGSLLVSLMRLLFLHKVFGSFPDRSSHFGPVHEKAVLRQCITLKVQEISLTISPENSGQPFVSRKAALVTGISYQDILSFQFSVDGFFLKYVIEISEKFFTFASGNLKVISFSTAKTGVGSYSEEYWKKEADEKEIPIWSEPAEMFHFPECTRDNATDDVTTTSVPQLDHLLGKLWLNWKDLSLESEGENIPNVQAPWILCEICRCLTDHGTSDSTSHFNCSLVVGKLNFNLQYYSFASIIVLLRQVRRAPSWSLRRKENGVLHTPEITIQDLPVVGWSSKVSSYCGKIEMYIIRMLPEKHVQIGVLMAGPHILISMSKDPFLAENSNLHHTQVSFDICSIEFLVSSNLEKNVVLDNTSEPDRQPHCLRPKAPQGIDIRISDSEAYRCQGQIYLDAYLKFNGLKAYFDDSSENIKHQILVLRPTMAQLSSMRKDHHSFGTSAIAVWAASHWVASGFSCLMFLDELYAFTKVINRLFYESLAFTVDGSDGDVISEEVAGRESVYTESECGQTFFARRKQTSFVTIPQVFVNVACELESFDVVLHNSRKSCSPGTDLSMVHIDSDIGRKAGMHDSSSNGICISIQQSRMELLFKGRNLDVVVDTTGVKCIIFRYFTYFDGILGYSELKSLLPSLDYLTEASVNHSKLCFCLRNLEKALPSASLYSTVGESSSHGVIFHMWGDSPLILDTEKLGDHWLFANIVISEIYTAGYEVKDILPNESEEFTASFSVGGEFQAVSCECKGGSMLLEPAAMTMFIECFNSYYQWVSELWPSGQSSGRVELAQYSSALPPLDDQTSVNSQQVQSHEGMWDHVEAVSVSVLHLSLVLVERDESGKFQELLFEVEFRFRFNLLNTVRDISAISKFSMLSRFMHGNPGQQIKHKDSIHPEIADTGGTSTSSSQRGSNIGISVSNPGQKDLYISPRRYILKDLQCSLTVEGPITREQIRPAYPNNIFVGSGSVSGFDMTISLREIKMVLSAFESFSKISSREETFKVESKHLSYNQEPGGSMEELVPDGTIVSIQDIDQHMYIAVEGADSGYDIAGAIHYSLVGERALFRVKYHKPRGWKPQVQYFYLISLYAKDNSGESLRMNCQPRSRIVDISCSNDSGSALWRVLPFKRDAYEDAIEQECSTSLSRSTFHLVNKKNDCAVAFQDSILEFVRKPGNLFKWKVFDDPGPIGNSLLQNGYITQGPSSPTTGSRDLSDPTRTGINSQYDSSVTDMGVSRTNGNDLGITVVVGKATLTIVHELSETEEKFPLLQGSIIPSQTVVQITNSKVRVMNTFEVILYHFDAQQNLWKEFIQPLEICTFYSQKFLVQGAEHTLQGVCKHFYAKINEVTVLLSELPLDMLLFVIGELGLAGPYAVKSSALLANCCKVENQSGLTLICQFYDNQDASVSAQESRTIFLRHLALANQPPEASYFSMQLVTQGVLSTSPIHLSLLETCQFAWRTRIVSSQDSKSFPGPFIAVEISKGIEDGLSISVSPLLKIQNETDFCLEMRFQRPEHEETESALLMLKPGDVIDDSMTAFSAINSSGGLRKTLTSLTLGNYVFSFRPNIADDLKSFKVSSVEWSDDLKGGKPVRLSGLFDKLSYQVRKAFSVNSTKFSMSIANCTLKSEEGFVGNIYFLIQTVGKAIPVVNPDNFGYTPTSRDAPVAMQERKEFFFLPTIRVSNFLHTEVHVSLTERDPHSPTNSDNTWSQANISSGSAVNFYVNPSTIFFLVTLTSFGSSCKPVNSSDWLRKLQKQKGDISHLDVELDFGGGKYFSVLRLSRNRRGTLEAGIFTPYALQNHTNVPLFSFAANQKPLSRIDMERFGTDIPPELGSYLPPNSITSWFLKCNKLCFKLLEEKALEAKLDLDVLSGLTEIDLGAEELFGSKNIMRLGVALRPSINKEVSSQIVTLSSRYVVCNESEDVIEVQQCTAEDIQDLIVISSKQSIALRLKTANANKKEFSIVENLLRKHTKSQNDLSFFIRFRPKESTLSWSGPVCVASLGRFFLKFRNSSENLERQYGDISQQHDSGEFATVHVVEEGSTIVLHFHRPPLTDLPYRIENCLHDAPITYYQKGSPEPETLGAGASVNYVWDDLTLPHKLVVQLDDVHMLREISLDKVRSWKPFYRNKQTRGLGFHLPRDKRPENQKRTTYSQSETVKVGFEVYAEGLTRVLRICEFSDSHKVSMVSGSSRKMRLRISYFSVHLLEHAKQEVIPGEISNYAPIVVTKLERINWDAMFTDQHKYSQIRVQSLSMDEKWVGAPFAAMLRRHQSENSDANDYILHVAAVLLPTSSNVRQVKYLSIVLQPLELNLDEETIMKIVPFWRRSLSDSSSPSQQYYFDHFEIHPIKIVASFLPGDSLYKYSSTQETMRSLLHSVIKIPAIKRKTVELNGVLVTHALITLRELTIKCAQHYSWYAMRAIYIAKGSPLLPPAFASLFDDLASSSLDVFFDPASGLLNLPGVTLGTLKLISKVIDNKGFSGTKRYFGDLGKTLKTAGSNMLFAAVTEVSDSVLKGAERSGFNGMVTGFHQGILKLAMEPLVLGSAFMEGGPDRKIKLDRSPGVDELYIEGYLQAMLDTMYKQEYLRVRVIENQVILKNLPPSTSLIEEIMDNVKGFLASKSLLKGEPSTSYSLRHIRGEREWRIGPTILTLCEHLFVSFMIRLLRKQSSKAMTKIKWKFRVNEDVEKEKAMVPASSGEEQRFKFIWKWGIGKFLLSGIVAYVDGRLCRNIPNPLARRIVSGFLLSFLDQSDDQTK